MSYPSQPEQPRPYGQPQESPATGQVPYQPTAYGTPPQPLPPKRRGLHPLAITGIVVGAVLAVCCIGGVVLAAFNTDDQPESSAGDPPPLTAAVESPTAAAAAAETEAEDQPAAGIGDPVRDGQFEFVVTEIETGIESVGDEFLGKEAQGQFVFVRLTVENISNESQLFDGSSQFLFDTEGREHSSDGEAAFYVENSDSFLNEINPGNSVEGVVVFDIPADATPASLRLHDSFLSGGVGVHLD